MNTMKIYYIVLAVLACHISDFVVYSDNGVTSLPISYNVVSIKRTEGACPTDQLLEETRDNIANNIREIILNSFVPLYLPDAPQCPCLSGRRSRIAFLNMSDPNHQCPTGWRLITSPRRACGRPSTGASCQSVLYPTNGTSYTRICGRIIAYQYCDTGAFNQVFYNPSITIDSYYVDGVIKYHPWEPKTACADICCCL